MSRFHLCAAVLLAAGAASAQSITILPGTPSVQLGHDRQFSATVTGLMNTAVTWYAGGVLGGNATAGTIDASGHYNAPQTMPGQNPVMITALGSDGKTSASTYAYLLTAGPTLTSVSPNPLPVGTYTVTVKGSGFVK